MATVWSKREVRLTLQLGAGVSSGTGTARLLAPTTRPPVATARFTAAAGGRARVRLPLTRRGRALVRRHRRLPARLEIRLGGAVVRLGVTVRT